jgi:4-hydroxyphenylpyruvate dioxygenase
MGLLRSQVLTLDAEPGRTLRLMLDTVPGSASTTGTLPPPRPGGVGHIAFRTDDIFTAAKHMHQRGFHALTIPENYYDDLAARLDLDSSQLSLMSRYSVLYDTDSAGGEFYHFYTPSIGNGLFFEVVQRTRGYAGHGEVNAPTRLAAQLHI